MALKKRLCSFSRCFTSPLGRSRKFSSRSAPQSWKTKINPGNWQRHNYVIIVLNRLLLASTDCVDCLMRTRNVTYVFGLIFTGIEFIINQAEVLRQIEFETHHFWDHVTDATMLKCWYVRFVPDSVEFAETGAAMQRFLHYIYKKSKVHDFA